MRIELTSYDAIELTSKELIQQSTHPHITTQWDIVGVVFWLIA